MNSLKTLYFPWTDIYSIRQYPIFLLFPQLHLLRPVEEGQESNPSDSFINSDFCQVHIPCPLGDNREKFMHLVSDIANRKDEYAAQLSSLTLAAMSEPINRIEKSEQSIVNEILTPKNLRSDSKEQQKEAELWQARLVLAIAAMLDREEEEIAANMAVLEDDETLLFKELQGEGEILEEDNLFEELIEIERQLGAGSAPRMKKRFRSWKTLFCESDIESDLWLTSSIDAGDQLIQLYEKESGKAQFSLTGLTLPAIIESSGAAALQKCTEFHQTNASLLTTLHQFLGKLKTEQLDSLKISQEQESYNNITQVWSQTLETYFPEKKYGRIPVVLHVFSKISCSELVGYNKYNKAGADTQQVNGLLLVAD